MLSFGDRPVKDLVNDLVNSAVDHIHKTGGVPTKTTLVLDYYLEEVIHAEELHPFFWRGQNAFVFGVSAQIKPHPKYDENHELLPKLCRELRLNLVYTDMSGNLSSQDFFVKRYVSHAQLALAWARSYVRHRPPLFWIRPLLFMDQDR